MSSKKHATRIYVTDVPLCYSVFVSYAANKLYVDGLKAESCTDCGRSFPSDAMDFDHVRGVKGANISDLLGGSRARLETELLKCELVCATCHRQREMTRRLDAHVDAADAFDADAALLEAGGRFAGLFEARADTLEKG